MYSRQFGCSYLKTFTQHILTRCCNITPSKLKPVDSVRCYTTNLFYEIPDRYKNAFYLANASFFDDVNWYLHKAYEIAFPKLVEDLLHFDKSLDESTAAAKVGKVISLYDQCNYMLDVRFPFKRDDGELELVRGFRAHHGLLAGLYPCMGGLRINFDVTRDQMKALAAHTTYKHACMGISLPGASGGLKINPLKYTENERKDIVSQYAKELYAKGFCGGTNDIFEPDINTGALEMSWISAAYSEATDLGKGKFPLWTCLMEACTGLFYRVPVTIVVRYLMLICLLSFGVPDGNVISTPHNVFLKILKNLRGKRNTECNTAAVGKPSMINGLPNFEKAGSQAAYFAIDYFLNELDLMKKLEMTPGIKNKTFIIEGLGKIGSNLAQYLENAGAMCVGVKEHDCHIYDMGGINIKDLLAYKERYGSIAYFAGMKPYEGPEIYREDCDLLVFAARQKSLMCFNADHVRAKVVVEAADGPVPPISHRILTSRGKLVIPDIYACAGASVAAYLEFLLDLGRAGVDVARISKGMYKNILQLLETKETYGVVSSNTTQKIVDSSMDSQQLTYCIESVMVSTANEIINIRKKYDLGMDVKTAAYVVAILNVYKSIFSLKKY